MKNLRISPIGVGDMLASSYFAVPTFQRSFAWKVDHVRHMLMDLTGALKRRKTDNYFLGSIVVVASKGAAPMEVVDGQQRLATISIIIAAIRDYHLKIGNDRAAGEYDQRFLRALHVPSGKRKPKLLLNEIDNRCYTQAILEPPAKRKKLKWTIPSHTRLIDAYNYAVEHIDSMSKVHSAKAAVESLYEFVEFMRENVQVIRVMVDDDADAFTVFETLNDRHLPLTVADLLKNFLLGSVGDAGIDEAKGNWREMLGALQTIKGKKDRIVDFIRQLWGSMHGLVREKELFRDIKLKILDEEEAKNLSSALAEQAADYAAVLNPHSDFWDRFGSAATEALSTFNTLRVERLRPMLLAILNKFSDSDIKSALNFLRAVAVRIVVTGGINGTIEEKIYELAVKIHKGQIKKTTQLMSAMRETAPNDAVFSAHFATMSITKGNLSRFYLRELEEVAKGDEDSDRDVSRDERRVTLEHIMPVAESERAAHWPGYEGELGAALAKRFGNHTLLGAGPNSKLNGRGYDEKRVVFAKCEGIYITRHIARDYDAWGEEQINARQLKLAELALQRWPLNIPPKKKVNGK